jgi:hypothetical protein
MTYLHRVELDASLNDIDGGEGSVGDRTTDTSGGYEKDTKIRVSVSSSYMHGTCNAPNNNKEWSAHSAK